MRRVLGLAIVALLAAAPALAAGWQTYVNERFGTSADVPADWKAGPEPENGDGLTFTAPDGSAMMTVWGGLQIFDSFDEGVDFLTAPNDGETITYDHADDGVVVVSGTRGDRIFYRKSLISCDDQIWNNLSIDYPLADKAKFDALVTHVAKSLKGGQGYQVEDCGQD